MKIITKHRTYYYNPRTQYIKPVHCNSYKDKCKYSYKRRNRRVLRWKIN